MFELYIINRNIIKYCRNKFIQDINKIENGNLSLITNYIDIIHQLNNFSDIIIYLYENQEYNLLLSNNNCINYIIKNLNNFNNLIEYLIYIKNFKFIYNYEEINEFIKNKYKLLIVSIDDINNNFNENDLKQEIQNNFSEIKLIWI